MGRRSRSNKSAGPWRTRLEVPPGLEPVLLHELRTLGLQGTADTGGVELVLDAADLLRVQRWSRIAARATVRLGTVGAESLEMLADRARKQPWALYVHPRQPLQVRATVTRSRLRYRERVESKVALAITDALRGPRLPGGRAPHEAVRIGVRVESDKAAFRVDASGELLHRRGWRRDPGRAPLRENLAAAVLQLAGWHPGRALLDPMAGSGTFAIEAACWTLGLAPGAQRRFACEDWPCWPKLSEPPPPKIADAGAPIYASDRDEGALGGARTNAYRARVRDRITWQTRPIEHVDLDIGDGVIVLNPPWGTRLGDVRKVARLHAQWSAMARERWPRATIAAIVPDRSWGRRAWGDEGEPAARFSSGGTRVAVWVHDPTGSTAPPKTDES